ncbi:hypothetical protein AMECASPLE_014364 [Ameca splendens]|uniref:Uncharacterized protein n=1 Tax=Ameca splendens TaxID=208324 RepID=A0ABV0Y1L2_9TELE
MRHHSAVIIQWESRTELLSSRWQHFVWPGCAYCSSAIYTERHHSHTWIGHYRVQTLTPLRIFGMCWRKICAAARLYQTLPSPMQHLGDDNTIVIAAPIAELSIVAPSKQKEVLKKYNSQVKLSVFVAQCAFAIKEDPETELLVKNYKASGKLLPFKLK